MTFEIKKQERESSHSLVRRFSKRIKNSRILFKARENRFRKRAKSEQMKKRSALRREELKKEYKMMEKLGLKSGNKFGRK